eukprot:m.25490 g.25490  ORF g.25490 m.25490 type:complete len:127 (+) comp28817_c0_seq3:304-684(+)
MKSCSTAITRSAIRLAQISRHLTPRYHATSRMLSQSSDGGEDDVWLQRRGNGAVITLNRPKALNAFNQSMARKIYPQLNVLPSIRALLNRILSSSALGGRRKCWDSTDKGHRRQSLLCWRRCESCR